MPSLPQLFFFFLKTLKSGKQNLKREITFSKLCEEFPFIKSRKTGGGDRGCGGGGDGEVFCVAYYVGCGYKGSWFADCLMCLACREGTASLASLVDTPHQTRAVELLIANAEVNFSNIFC